MALRDDLVQYYRWLRDYGYNDSHSGNASVREGDFIWVTPTGAFAELLKPHDLIACPLDGEIPQAVKHEEDDLRRCRNREFFR